MWMERRKRMVAEQLRGRDIIDPAVLEAMGSVAREQFVDPAQVRFAYDDGPLSIGHGQTISQPYIVAITAQSLGLHGTENVLDIGSGLGALESSGHVSNNPDTAWAAGSMAGTSERGRGQRLL